MQSEEILTNNQYRHYKSEFIHKLVDMMNKYSKFISWSLDGLYLQIFNKKQFSKKVIPEYFRHSNFDSFLRQLHLYDFKQNKQIKNKLLFKHNIFYRNNQKQFINIQRIKKKKQKQQLLNQIQNNEFMNEIITLKCLTPQHKQLLNSMLCFKFIMLQKNKNLKKSLNNLVDNINIQRNKTLQQPIDIIKDQIMVQFQQINNFSKSIDMFIKNTLQERNQTFQNQQRQKQQYLKLKNTKTQQSDKNQSDDYLFHIKQQNQSVELNSQNRKNINTNNWKQYQQQKYKNYQNNKSNYNLMIYEQKYKQHQYNRNQNGQLLFLNKNQPSMGYVPIPYSKQSMHSFGLKWPDMNFHYTQKNQFKSNIQDQLQQNDQINDD